MIDPLEELPTLCLWALGALVLAALVAAVGVLGIACHFARDAWTWIR